jgi:hypothetical protein
MVSLFPPPLIKKYLFFASTTIYENEVRVILPVNAVHEYPWRLFKLRGTEAIIPETFSSIGESSKLRMEIPICKDKSFKSSIVSSNCVEHF